jgi:uncharacterized protein YqiB (DUF1249 family)
LKTIYENIYDKLNELGVFDVKESVHAKSGDLMDLVVEQLGKNHFSLSHYFEQNGDLVSDPDMEVRVIPEMKMAEALTYQDQFGFQRVYPETDKIDVKAKKDLNAFLNNWLNNLLAQGFKIPKE